MDRAQFRILYRQFLFRMADIETLSAHAAGDSDKLVGRFAALLIFASVVLSLPTLGGTRDTGLVRLGFMIASEHFLIQVTMVTVGLFAVLCWDSFFPDRRDVLTLAPLPVRFRTLFFAKIAAVGTALALTIAALHSGAGILWPANFSAARAPREVPSFAFDHPLPPVSAADMEATLTRELGPLPLNEAMAVGVVRDGVRRTWTYGVARRDTLFEIASISKTFTGLLLAQMVDEGRVRLDDRVAGRDITLLDLATHRSGLPRMPDDANGPEYEAEKLTRWLRRAYVVPRDYREFKYSNAGFSVLGLELANRAGVSYPDLLRDRITTPLGLRDTVVRLSPDQQDRMAQGWRGDQPIHRWDMDALAPAGGIRSTVEDMLTYATAWLNGLNRTALVLRADMMPGRRIGLAWIYETATGCYWHNGATGGYTSHLYFCPKGGYAGVVLANHGPQMTGSPDLIGEHIRQRFAGQPALSLSTPTIPGDSPRHFFRWLASYWITMAAAGGFAFSFVLALQAFAALLLPRQIFLRASGLLQLATFCLCVAGAILEPKFPDFDALISPEGQLPFIWSPTYWFLGVFHSMNGLTHPALTRLGHMAWLAFGISVAVAAIGYALAYVRILKQTVEAPDIAPSTTIRWLPRFGGPLPTAVAQFAIRTLARSRQHRLILAFYLGIGFALTVVVVRTPLGGKAPIFLASTLTMGFAVAGMRVVFALPLDLRANWTFQTTPLPGPAALLRARRRALLALAVAPVWCVSTAASFWTMPARLAAGHALILALLGLIAAEVALLGPVKIPFTCSYLPGRSNLHVTFWMCIFGIESLAAKSVEWEYGALQQPWGLPVIAIPMMAIFLALRWTKEPTEVRFEEEPPEAVVRLGLSGI
jgi:CubicO group peptidase (beta-lactamase class C family)